MKHHRARTISGLLCALALGCAAPQQGEPQSALPAPAAPVAAIPVSPPQPPALRLPRDVRPEHYAVALTVDPREDAFSGTVDVDVVLTAPARVVWMHAKELDVTRAVIRVGGRELPARAVPTERDFLAVLPEAELPAGKAQVHLAFRGTQSLKDSAGAFRQQDRGEWYTFTKLEPVHARKVFPSFDEPAFKTPYQLTLRVPGSDQAFANTPVASEEKGADGWRTVRFAQTRPLPTYLVAFGVGPFEVVDAGTAGANKVPLRIIVPKGRTAEARWAAESTPKLLDEVERFFAMPYPFEKLDTLVIPVTSGFGAMENVGLIGFASSLALSPPDQETLRFRRDFAHTQAHEIAHMWFGNLVTPEFWDDIWLNESFATWLADKIIESWKPEWNTQADRVRNRNTALGADSLVTARRIRQPIQTEGDIRGAFDGITYAKGGAVLTMFEASVGEEAFRRGIQGYLRKHAYGTAKVDDFLAGISEGAGRDLGPAFSTFLEQGGAPQVSFQLACAQGRPPELRLSQRRYVPLGSQATQPQTWRVPVCVRYGGATGSGTQRACTELKAETGTLKLQGACPTWVVPNTEGSGYYRAKLEGQLLPQLFAHGGTQLTTLEKVALLSDAQALSQSGDLPAGDALALAGQVLPSNDSDVVQSAAALADVREDLLGSALRPRHARFLRRLFGAQARRLGFTPRPGESEVETLLRPRLLTLVALRGEDPVLRKEALALARRWLADRKAVHPELVGTVLRVAASVNDAGLHGAFTAALLASPERQERRLLLNALSAFSATALVQKNLDVVLGGKIDVRESLTLLGGTAGDPRSREVGAAWIRDHYDALVQAMPPSSVAYLPTMASAFCDPAQRQEAQAFYAPRAAKVPGAERLLAQALERVDQCIAMKAAQGPSLQRFLSRQ